MAEANEARVSGNSLFVNGFRRGVCKDLKYMLVSELVQEFPESIELGSICCLNKGVCFLKRCL